MIEAIENWYLGRLVPWFMYVAQYVGLLVLYYGIARILAALFHWELPVTFLALFILSSLLYNTVKERQKKVWAESEYIAQTPTASSTIDVGPTYGAKRRKPRDIRKTLDL